MLGAATGITQPFSSTVREGRRPRPWMLAIAASASGLGLIAGCGSVPSSAASASQLKPAAAAAPAVAPAACASGTCWVAVSAATLWVKPGTARPVDQPALSNPAHPGTWVKVMTLAQKQWLVGRLETQALYGTKVTVIGHWKNWTHVTVPSQPTNRDTRGYPGWVPTVQLTSTPPPASATYVVVRSAAAWVRSSWTPAGVTGKKILLVAYDSRFTLVRATASYVEVALIGGQHAALPRSDVVVHTTGTSWGITRAKVVAEAKKFLGLAYLWAGTSGFGYDCSGFTYSAYHASGLTLSRDADQQAVHGTPVARDALQPGDLVFFRGSASGPITHVGMYVGGGNMIDAPNTNAVIRIEPVSGFGIYAGARRYLSG